MSQTMSVRLTDEEVELIQSAVKLHHRLGDIPEATPSAYSAFSSWQISRRWRRKHRKGAGR
jgi:hypothetical protein